MLYRNRGVRSVSAWARRRPAPESLGGPGGLAGVPGRAVGAVRTDIRVLPFKVDDGSARRPSYSAGPGRSSLAAPTAGVVRLLDTLRCAAWRRRKTLGYARCGSPGRHQLVPRTTATSMRRSPTGTRG